MTKVKKIYMYIENINLFRLDANPVFLSAGKGVGFLFRVGSESMFLSQGPRSGSGYSVGGAAENLCRSCPYIMNSDGNG